MRFTTRVVVSLLTGIGAGLLGFWAMWNLVWEVFGRHPGLGHDAWLLAGIFVPGVIVPLTVFRALDPAQPTNAS